MTAPFRSKPPTFKPNDFPVNEDPERLDKVYVDLLGKKGDQVLTEEVKWLAVTHKSFDHGRRGYNDRLAFLGIVILFVCTRGLWLMCEMATKKSSSQSQPDSYGRTPFKHPALENVEALSERSKGQVMDTSRMFMLAERYGLPNVVRWKPKNIRNMAGSGQPLVMGQALYAIVGAVAYERGGEFANKISAHGDKCLNRDSHDVNTVPRFFDQIVPSSVVVVRIKMPPTTAGMASALFFLDLKGKTLLARNYRGDIPMSAVEKFPILLSEAEEESSAVPPCFSDEGINYLYIRHSNLYLLALTKRNTNATEILLFLHKIVEVFTEYFKELEEESIRDNFVIIYELLDEMMDFGYPQTTESKILQEYITQESHKLEIQARPPIAVTNAVSWRSEGIRYRKNEVFLDVIESLNLLVSSTGNVLRSEILGAVKLKCYLSGMPELRLGLNDKVMFETTGRATRGKAVEMEDVKFHQCVRLSRFENDRTISFIPPDGEFELMSYRLNTQVKPLIWVESDVRSHSGSRIEYTLKARAQFKRRSTANNVEILVPVPEDADSPRFRTNIGSVHYAPEKSAIVWKIKQFGGGKEFLMRAELGLPSVKGDDELGGGMTGGFGGSMGGVAGMGGGGKGKRPISVKFEIPYFTTSGIQVRYLKIIEPKLQYPSLPWVRYITQSGDIAVRLPDVQ
ncbi:20S-pre-rRNA D-site endonuclease nob1 [Physcia stellaris]|nr:20S-pre-rRNA D-site endonuclease nob1 [Physcia stellaris]